jgi:hypothetical protein
MWANRVNPELPGREHEYDGGCPWCRADRLPHDRVVDGNAHDAALELLDLIDRQRQEIDALSACLERVIPTAERGERVAVGPTEGWPTDHLRDLEWNVQRLWNTVRTEDPDEDTVIEMRPSYAVGLAAVEDALARARSAAVHAFPADALGPIGRVGQLIGFLRSDLEDGVCRLDVTGGELRGGYDASFEEAIEPVWTAWEAAEWDAGRPRMGTAAAGDDIADRLGWDRLPPFTADEQASTRARLGAYTQDPQRLPTHRQAGACPESGRGPT